MLALLYFYGLDRTGMLGPDEPRYAAIGREMASSGDWVTPRLWGSAWFEKPPLLYWSTAMATKAGLNPDQAPRVPVALMGFGFLVFFYFWMRREFGLNEAFYSIAILGASAGWLAYSLVAVTDIPLSASFCATLLLCTAKMTPKRGIAAGVLLGLAVLAKGLVPYVLFVPLLWHLRKQWKLLAIVLGVSVVVAAPWYVAVTLRNGQAFIDEFIWKHHFQRFASNSLAHVRPPWFYVPVLLAGLFPWTPLLASVRKDLVRDERLKFIALWLAWGFVFFSASRNKLPGYILPLVPAVALLTGVALARLPGRSMVAKIALPIAALLIGVVPIAASVVPQALVVGLSHSKIQRVDLGVGAGGGVRGPACASCWSTRIVALTRCCWWPSALGITLFQTKVTLLPALDRQVSVRAFYRRHPGVLDRACVKDVNRDNLYGLQYYLGHPLPVCEAPGASPKILGIGNRLVLID